MPVFDDAPYEPSPWEPVAAQVERYERSDGSETSELAGERWVILWTLGARSGKVRKTPLVRVADDEGARQAATERTIPVFLLEATEERRG